MTITMCPSNDDEHGEFPHRLVIPVITLTKHGKTTTTMGPVFVICAHCDHWVERSIPSCKCRERCHERAAITRERARRIRYRSVTSASSNRGNVVLVKPTA